jgi:glycosyltransferase involved in cell wall biosynthesis
MELSVIIPCFNEERTIKEIILKVKNSLKSLNITHQIIVIDDKSTDKTKNILETELRNSVDKIIFNTKNFGKGYSIKQGIECAMGKFILIQDADFEYNPNDYKKILKPLQNELADVVYGSRFIGGNERRVLYFWHSIGNKFLTIMSNMFSNLNLTDMEVGYKVFKTEILKNIKLKENRFGFEPEITAKIAKMNVRIYEVGISYYGRSYNDGKKITWKDGFSAIRCIIQYNLFK